MDKDIDGSNNTNKLSPQEHTNSYPTSLMVQIIQINLVLKNVVAWASTEIKFK